MGSLFSRMFLATCLAGASSASLAQEGSYAPPSSSPQFEVELGIGGVLKPRYPSSDSYLVSPYPILSVGAFYFPGIGQVTDSRRKTGIYFFPSFNFMGERKAKDDRALTGMKDVDWAFEAGLGAGFRAENWRAFAELRQGFNGHTGQAGQIGADAIVYPTDKLEVSFGPRAAFGFGDYMDTYFGVTAAESAASGGRLKQFKADSGFTSVGLAARASYSFNEKTRFHLQAEYDRLVGDAANSPIADAGSKNQFSIGAGVSYKFSFDLF